MSQSAEEKEQEYFRNTLNSYDDYARYHVRPSPLLLTPLTPAQLAVNHIRRMNYLTLPKAQRHVLAELGYRDKLDAVDEGIRR
jgi:carnosine N-methyltransferase